MRTMRPIIKSLCHQCRGHRIMALAVSACAIASMVFVGYQTRAQILATTEIEDLSVQEVTIAPVQEWTGGASNLPNLEINNWVPAGIQTKSFIVTRGADNEGTRITGIDSTNIADGAVRFLVNLPTGASPPTDSGTLTFVHESSLSTAANRIQTPAGVDCTFPMYSVIGLVYGGLDGTAAGGVKRWRLISNCGWTGGSGTTATQMLRFYPHCSVGNPTPISGTFHDYRPTCLNLAFNAGYWIAGALTDSADYSVLSLYVDSSGATLTGLYTTANQVDPKAHGAVKIVRNLGPGTLTLKHLDPGSSVNLRFNLPQERDLILKKNESVILFTPLNNAIDLGAQWYPLSVGASNEQFPSATVAGATELQAALELSGITTPSALASGTTHNYNPGSRNAVWRLTAHASNSTLTGIVAPALGDHEVHLVENVGTGNLIFTHGDAGSSTANQFQLPRSLTLTLPVGGGALIRYDQTAEKWFVIANTRVANDVTYTALLTNSLLRFADANGTVTTAAVTDNGSTIDIGASRSVTISGNTSMSSGNSFSGGVISAQAPSWADRLVPTALTSGSNNNDWNPTDLHTRVHIALQTSTGSLATLTGMASGGSGELKTLCNFGTGPVKITHNDSNSGAANRFTLSEGRDLTLPIVSGKMYCVHFRYDSSDTRWEEMWTNFYGRNPGVPSASSCGTGPAFNTNASNETFTVTTGTGATACTITFGNSGFTTTPTCSVTAQDGTARAYTVSTTAVSLTAASASASYDVICQGR